MHGLHCGWLEEREQGTSFQYLPLYKGPAISLTMPVRTESYEHPNLHPFFENLLPEGWLLELSTSKLKISKDDIFGILIATCADCIGAVEVREDNS